MGAVQCVPLTSVSPEMAERIRSEPVRSWLPVVWYPRAVPLLPDFLVGRFPEGIASPVPWPLWVSETPDDARFLEKALDERGRLLQGPRGLLLHLPLDRSKAHRSKLPPHTGTQLGAAAIYEPPPSTQDFPFFTMVMMPTTSRPLDDLLRGRYAYDFYDTLEDVSAAARRIYDAFPERGRRLVRADQYGTSH